MHCRAAARGLSNKCSLRSGARGGNVACFLSSPVAIREEASEMNIILEVCCSVLSCHAGMVQFFSRWIKGEK